ncbi:NYN domain-containing protein [Roseovarius sp. B08]|uniref:NYN domain-containing protein n=1 Tax=Roseovarius sp. B08 TaxID=3449223 RepID=UPI003EDC0B7A
MNLIPVSAAFYIDGFNLYHGIKDLGKDHLKWINYWKLAQLLIPQVSEELVKVVYCTAYYPDDEAKKERHRRFLNVQERCGVTVKKGHYAHERRDCGHCGGHWWHPTEKQGDINVAINMIRDAGLGTFEHGYLLTSDSDQAATAKMIREELPDIKLTTVRPPSKNFSKHIMEFAHNKMSIKEGHLERCVLPARIPTRVGAVQRPAEYDPPPGWIHPDAK